MFMMRISRQLLSVSACVALCALCVSLSACNTREIGKPKASSALSGEAARVEIFSEDFSGSSLASHWVRGKGEDGSGKWRIEDGALRGDDIKNDPLWLKKPLPAEVRVEFEATSLSDDGDLKFEIFGDGTTHASGYIVIFGGWKNALDVIARLDEHGKDRLAKPSIKVVPRKTHRLALERRAGQLRFYIDDKLVLTYNDPNPLTGPSHQFFAFNDWTAPVRFDNLKIYELKPAPASK